MLFKRTMEDVFLLWHWHVYLCGSKIELYSTWSWHLMSWKGLPRKAPTVPQTAPEAALSATLGSRFSSRVRPQSSMNCGFSVTNLAPLLGEAVQFQLQRQCSFPVQWSTYLPLGRFHGNPPILTWSLTSQSPRFLFLDCWKPWWLMIRFRWQMVPLGKLSFSKDLASLAACGVRYCETIVANTQA